MRQAGRTRYLLCVRSLCVRSQVIFQPPSAQPGAYLYPGKLRLFGIHLTVEPSRAPVAKALPTPLGRAFRFSASRPPSVSTQALPLFLFPENVVPVILVGLGHRLLAFAHTLLL